MFRNMYDSDVTVWSPQGRLHQVDYAVEAMKQGSATVGIRSKTHAVLVGLKRSANELTAYQKKAFEVDRHVGVTIAGLLSDGRILSRFLVIECKDHRYDFNESAPLTMLTNKLRLRLQENTQIYGRRPFGVGLLIAGYDRDGPHIYKSDPSADVSECIGWSIGARSQSARTYLERNVDNFESSTLDELIVHALSALRDTLPNEEQLSVQNTEIAVVGKAQPFKIQTDDEVRAHLARLAQVNPPPAAAAPAAAAPAPQQQQPPAP